MDSQEVTKVDGGGFWAEVAKACGGEIALAAGAKLSKLVIADYKSRTRAPRTATKRYNPWP